MFRKKSDLLRFASLEPSYCLLVRLLLPGTILKLQCGSQLNLSSRGAMRSQDWTMGDVIVMEDLLRAKCGLMFWALVHQEINQHPVPTKLKWKMANSLLKWLNLLILCTAWTAHAIPQTARQCTTQILSPGQSINLSMIARREKFLISKHSTTHWTMKVSTFPMDHVLILKALFGMLTTLVSVLKLTRLERMVKQTYFTRLICRWQTSLAHV